MSILVWFGNTNGNGNDIMGFVGRGARVLIFNLFANFRIISYGYSSTYFVQHNITITGQPVICFLL